MAALNGGYLVRLLFISLLDLFKKGTRKMNANELSDELQRIHNEDIVDGVAPQLVNAIAMLRQQQAEIERLIGSKPITYGMLTFCKNCGEQNPYQSKTLTDEEINKLWAESHEDGIAMQQGFTTQQHYFAHLILKKAGEK